MIILEDDDDNSVDGDDDNDNSVVDNDGDDNDINVVDDDDLPIPPKGVGSKAALAIGALPADDQHDLVSFKCQHFVPQFHVHPKSSSFPMYFYQ